MSAFVMWQIIAFLAFGALASVASVGKPRKPLEPGVAALSVLFNALIIAAIIAYWGAS